MRKLRQATSRGISAVSHAIQQQPDYCSEVSDEYVTALQNHVNKSKPKGFKLTPISEPGVVTYRFFPFSTAPAPYDVVWSNFPTVEDPKMPAPKPRPALVRQAFQDQDGNPWVKVVYGTSKDPYRGGPADFSIVTLSEMQVCGLKQATRFRLDRELELPWSREFFECLADKPTPIIGHMPAYEVRKLQIQIAHLQNLIARLQEATASDEGDEQ